MRRPAEKEHDRVIRDMFARIANKYVLVNYWMTWGQDSKWRSEVLDLAHLQVGSRLLDIGSGTGDLALQAVYLDKTLLVVAADYTSEMMHAGRCRPGGERIKWINADALELPFNSGSFDTVVSGYLLRNVIDINRALAEQYRLLKWGGRMVSLDTTPLPDDACHFPVRLYVKYIIPLIGGFFSGDRKAYTYLHYSTQRFLKADELKTLMQNAGFREVGFKRFMAGTMAIHWGIK